MQDESNVFAVGVDLGGTKIGVGLVDISGNVVRNITLPTDVKGGPSAIQEQILSSVGEMRKFLTDTELLVGIGIGVPGQIEKGTEIIDFAPNLNWRRVPLKENLSRILRLPVAITNDVRAATWGEWLYGSGKDCDDLICMFVGTGIGGGIVSGGRIIEGCSNTAGEIGHMVIDMAGPPCACGNKGCLEAWAGGRSIAERVRKNVQIGSVDTKFLMDRVGGEVDKITTKIIIEAARENDKFSRQFIDQAISALVVGCSALVNAFNPCRIVLGGGVMEGLREYLPVIEKGIKKNALSAATTSLEVVPSKLHAAAGIVGGAALIFHSYREQRNSHER